MKKFLFCICFVVFCLSGAEQIFRPDILPGAKIPAPEGKTEKLLINPASVNAGTLTMWLRAENWSNESDKAWHFFVTSSNNDGASIMLYRHPEGETRLLFKKSDGVASDIRFKVPFVADEWIHLAFSFAADEEKNITELSFYVNGKKVSTRKASFVLNNFPNSWQLGDTPRWNPKSIYSTTCGRCEYHERKLSDDEISGIAGQRFVNGRMSVMNYKFIPTSTNTVYGVTAPGAEQLEVCFFDEIGKATVEYFPCRVKKDGTFSAELKIPSDTVSTKMTVLKRDRKSPVWKITGIKYANFLPDFRPDFWRATWIWHQEYSGKPMRRFFRKTFNADPDKLAQAALQYVSDGKSEIFVNGQSVAVHGNWAVPSVRDNLLGVLKKGKNVIAVEGYKHAGAAGIFGELSLVGKDGSLRKIGTDKSWKASADFVDNWNKIEFNDDVWAESEELMRPPQAPYGDTPYRNFATIPELRPLDVSKNIEVDPGSSAEVDFSFAPLAKKPAAPVYIVLMRKGMELFRTEARFISGTEKLLLKGKIPVPELAMPEEYDIKLSCLSVKFDGIIGKLIVKPSGKTNKKLVAKVEKVNGTLQLMLNGKAVPFMLYRNAINFRNTTVANTFITGFDRAGVRLSEINLNLKFIVNEDGTLNTDVIDLYLLSPLYYAPQSRWVIFFHVDAPKWLVQRYPDERFVKEDGRPIDQLSYASENYRREICTALEKIITYIKSKPYYNSIIGFGLDGGEDGQFMQWTGRPIQYFGDYSVPMKKLFHRKLEEKYSTVGKLNAAWQSSYKSFDEIPIPGVARRRGSKTEFFLDPVRDADVVEFNRVFGTAPADFMLACAETIKKNTDFERITAAYYGKFFSIAGYIEYGELAISKVLNSPYMDYLIAVEYNLRGSGLPHSISAVAESYTMHNKVFVDEADIRTFLSGSKRWAYAGSCFETVSQIRKMFIFSFVRGHGVHWYDLHGGVFENKAIFDAIGRTGRVAAENLSSPRKNAEIACIVDEESFLYTSSSIKNATSVSIRHQQSGILNRIGAPVDCYFAADLDKIPEYKMYIFLNFYAPSAKIRAEIDKLKRDGKVLVFLGNAGFVGSKTPAENMEALSGIKVKQADKNLPVVLKFEPQLSPEPFNKLSKISYLSTGNVYPVMLPDDPDALVFGKFSMEENWKPLAFKDFKTHKVFFSSTAAVPAELYRKLAEIAGVHIISHDDNTFVYAGRNMLGVHTAESGVKKLHWHENATFTDAITGKVYGRNTKLLKLPMQEYETIIMKVK